MSVPVLLLKSGWLPKKKTCSVLSLTHLDWNSVQIKAGSHIFLGSHSSLGLDLGVPILLARTLCSKFCVCLLRYILMVKACACTQPMFLQPGILIESPPLLHSQHFGWNATDVLCGKYSHNACVRGRECRQGWRGEKWVPCAECWTPAPVLWPVKGNMFQRGCASVWTSWKGLQGSRYLF